MPVSGFSLSQVSTALPNPYQPGSISRHWAQLNTQGMARRSSMRSDLVREAGREPVERDTLYRNVVRTEDTFTVAV